MVRLKDVLNVRNNKELYELYKKISNYRGDMIEIEYSPAQKTHDILVVYLCDALTDRAMFEALALASFSHEYYNLVSLSDSAVQVCELEDYPDRYGVFNDQYDNCNDDCVVPILYEKWLEWGIVYIGVNNDKNTVA